MKRIMGLDYGSKTVGVAVSDTLLITAQPVETIWRKSEFKDALIRRTGLEVVMLDERLTTVEAAEVLNEAGVKVKDQKQYLDKMAAAFILQDYLNSMS